LLVQPKQLEWRQGLEGRPLAVLEKQHLLLLDCWQLESLLLAQLVLALGQWKSMHRKMGQVRERSQLLCLCLLVQQV
jgi:hypothetical protein